MGTREDEYDYLFKGKVNDMHVHFMELIKVMVNNSLFIAPLALHFEG